MGVIGTEVGDEREWWCVVDVAEALVVGQLVKTHRIRIQYRSRCIDIDRRRIFSVRHRGIGVLGGGEVSVSGGLRCSGCWAFVGGLEPLWHLEI